MSIGIIIWLVVLLESSVLLWVTGRWISARDEAAYKQAKIDQLMLEYCPDEMTLEQIENWANHQVPSTTRFEVIP